MASSRICFKNILQSPTIPNVIGLARPIIDGSISTCIIFCESFQNGSSPCPIVNPNLQPKFKTTSASGPAFKPGPAIVAPRRHLDLFEIVPTPIMVVITGICKYSANSCISLHASARATPPPEIINGFSAFNNKSKASLINSLSIAGFLIALYLSADKIGILSSSISARNASS